jgi:hypothetical protein
LVVSILESFKWLQLGQGRLKGIHAGVKRIDGQITERQREVLFKFAVEG